MSWLQDCKDQINVCQSTLYTIKHGYYYIIGTHKAITESTFGQFSHKFYWESP